MSMAVIREFFMWCSVINGVLLVLSVVLCAFAGDWIYRIHGRWYSIPRDSFNMVLYAFVGLLKILFIVFNLTPYLALVIVGV